MSASTDGRAADDDPLASGRLPFKVGAPPRAGIAMPTDRETRIDALKRALSERILVLDGAMGTSIQALDLTAADFGGPDLEGCNENLVLTRPDVIRGIHDGFLAAGADIVETDTFGATPLVLAEYDLAEQARAINLAPARLGTAVPIAVSGTVEVMGTLLAGQDVEAFYVSLAHRDLLWIGLNCATGPDFMTDHLRTLAQFARFSVACVPNAGLPDENGRYNETPPMISQKVGRFIDDGWVNLIGGCCGTVAEHIALLADAARGKPPRRIPDVRRSAVSGIETLVIDEDTRPIIVGERTNVLGSRKFKQLIAAGAIEEASEIGRLQVRRGAHLIDVCLQDPDRPEVEDVTKFLEMVAKKVKVPIMLDSTDAKVLEEGLKRTQGKSLINSINLEDGEERFKRVVPLARTFGAALVVGCIDEDKAQAQAVTRARKLAIAERSYALLTETYGVQPEDIMFDALVFPVGTGDQNYIGSGVETIEGIRLIKEKLPRSKTILGVSNVSFGLPVAGREVLNSVFLYHCVQAGLDMAIVNSEKLERYSEIPAEERKLAEDLIWWRGDDPIAAFAA